MGMSNSSFKRVRPGDVIFRCLTEPSLRDYLPS